MEDPFIATPYKVSTITANGEMNCGEIDLKLLFQHVPIVSMQDPAVGVTYIEFGSNKNEVMTRGDSPKRKKKLKQDAEKKTCKRFDNQATTVIKMQEQGTYVLNMKVFQNGVVQITGIKNMEDGKRVIEIFIDIVKTMCQHNIAVVKHPEQMQLMNYKIRLINTDFKLMQREDPAESFELKREWLHSILIEKYGNKCTYEPCIYQGVKLQYFWNVHNTLKNGNCMCRKGHCNGKGVGDQEHFCKKITIAIFQSGCIIITGANHFDQVQDCYSYIIQVIRDNIEQIRKKKLIPIQSLPAASKISKPSMVGAPQLVTKDGKKGVRLFTDTIMNREVMERFMALYEKQINV